MLLTLSAALLSAALLFWQNPPIGNPRPSPLIGLFLFLLCGVLQHKKRCSALLRPFFLADAARINPPVMVLSVSSVSSALLSSGWGLWCLVLGEPTSQKRMTWRCDERVVFGRGEEPNKMQTTIS
jgi:hypothetical protein